MLLSRFTVKHLASAVKTLIISEPVNHSRGSSDLLDALVEELEAGVPVADEGTLLDELSEHLSPRQLTVELLLRSVPRLQETCRKKTLQYLRKIWSDFAAIFSKYSWSQEDERSFLRHPDRCLQHHIHTPKKKKQPLKSQTLLF